MNPIGLYIASWSVFIVSVLLIYDLVPQHSLPVAPHLEALKAASPHITDHEKAHIRAVMAYAYRNIPGAVDEWMSILICHPRGWYFMSVD